MKELFPKQHVMGFGFSLLLTIVALAVVKFDMSLNMAFGILLVTALAQATVQLVLFMHIGESEDKNVIYNNFILSIRRCCDNHWYIICYDLGL